jgi:1-acyl-sn-glycerol-3-phosphate acyltransferase
MLSFLHYAKLSLFWVFLQFMYLFCWLLHLILYPYLKWVKRIQFPFTYLHLLLIRQLFGVRFRFLNKKQQSELFNHTCILLSNHRSWADFFICCLTTNSGRSGYISRASVGFLLPIVFLWEAFVQRNAIVFNRGKKTGKVKSRLFTKVAAFLRRGGLLLVFPEGHRYLGEGTLPLKRGIIKWAYSNQQPCAVVLHYGNEHVLNEKKMSLNRGVEVVCDHRGVFDPVDFATEGEFFNRISQEFSLGYKEMRGAM